MTKDWGTHIKALCKIHGQDVLPGIKLPVKRKGRRKELGPRKQPEKVFKKWAVPYLRRHGWKVYLIENSVCGDNNDSIPDSWISNRYRKWAGWCEFKAENGRLDNGQIEFKNECHDCNARHVVFDSKDGVRHFVNTAGKSVAEWVTGVKGARL